MVGIEVNYSASRRREPLYDDVNSNAPCCNTAWTCIHQRPLPSGIHSTGPYFCEHPAQRCVYGLPSSRCCGSRSLPCTAHIHVHCSSSRRLHCVNCVRFNCCQLDYSKPKSFTQFSALATPAAGSTKIYSHITWKTCKHKRTHLRKLESGRRTPDRHSTAYCVVERAHSSPSSATTSALVLHLSPSFSFSPTCQNLNTTKSSSISITKVCLSTEIA